MSLVFCRGCGASIHTSAIQCPKCGAPQQGGSAVSGGAQSTDWLAIVSLVLGIFSTLMLFDDSEWDTDTKVGLLMFSISAGVCGIISLNKSTGSRGMATAGLVMAAIATLAGVGLLFG